MALAELILPDETPLLFSWSHHLPTIQDDLTHKLRHLTTPPPEPPRTPLAEQLKIRASQAQTDLAGRTGRSPPDITDLPALKRHQPTPPATQPPLPTTPPTTTTPTPNFDDLIQAVVSHLQNNPGNTHPNKPVVSSPTHNDPSYTYILNKAQERLIRGNLSNLTLFTLPASPTFATLSL